MKSIDKTIKTCSFFGHRIVFNSNSVKKRLLKKTEELILRGFNNFMIGTHGDFDSLTLSVLRELKTKYDIKITIVFSSVSKIIRNKNSDCSDADLYQDLNTLIFDIEEQHFKNRITYTNYKMIDISDSLICYVNVNKLQSGAKNAMNYALKNKKEIHNIFEQTDILNIK